MVRKYAHLSSEHLTGRVDRLSSLKLVSNDAGEMATIGATQLEKKKGWISLTL